MSSAPVPDRPGPVPPATRDQADAYRYAVRRLESALVHGDPVPLHEQIRTQRRAVAAGVVLGVLALIGAFVAGLVAPQPPAAVPAPPVVDRLVPVGLPSAG